MIKAPFEISMYIRLQNTQTINGTWRLSSLKARTKVSLIWLIRSQQLCRGTRHIGLTIKFFSDKKHSLRLGQNKIRKLRQSLMRLHHMIALRLQQLCRSIAIVW